MILPSFGYCHQGTNNLMFSIGAIKLLDKNHSYIGLFPGTITYKTNGKRQFSPNLSLEFFYETKSKIGMGPVLTANYNRYKIDGLKSNYISFDIGWAIGFVDLFGGYNLNLDKKTTEPLTPFRVGVKFL